LTFLVIVDWRGGFIALFGQKGGFLIFFFDFARRGAANESYRVCRIKVVWFGNCPYNKNDENGEGPEQGAVFGPKDNKTMFSLSNEERN
jgi:hypothetical protein